LHVIDKKTLGYLKNAIEKSGLFTGMPLRSEAGDELEEPHRYANRPLKTC